MKPALFSKWCNAVADAYNRGEAPWAYPDGTSELVRVWRRAFEDGGGDAADEAAVQWALERGVSLKKRRT